MWGGEALCSGGGREGPRYVGLPEFVIAGELRETALIGVVTAFQRRVMTARSRGDATEDSVSLRGRCVMRA